MISATARQPRPVDRPSPRGAPGCRATIVVPHGNSREKNAAMRALGARADRARPRLPGRARACGAPRRRRRPALRPRRSTCDLVRGVADLLGWNCSPRAATSTVVYVPIGQGSGVCACDRRAQRAGPARRGSSASSRRRRPAYRAVVPRAPGRSRRR
ncbi:MAG: hypothetical protein MZW92_48045 [Comamonadaceae bacterium]|nr:hypothetical protein [Comamonadaceae bacterium]